MRNVDLEPYQNMISEGRSVEEVLSRLRRDGHSRIESIKVLMTLQDCSLTEAKRAVHASDTWKNAREDAEAVHESLIEHLDDESEAD